MKLQKTNLFILALILCLAGFTACNDIINLDDYTKNGDNGSDGNTQELKNIIDSLVGEWEWIKTYGGFGGNTTDNEFKSIVKILSQNKDSSINYEVFVEDTLFYKGSFQVQYIHRYEQWYDTELNIKIPHDIWRYEYDHLYSNWLIQFQSWEAEWNGNHFETKKTKDTLQFWDGAMDGYFHYYQKIK